VRPLSNHGSRPKRRERICSLHTPAAKHASRASETQPPVSLGIWHLQEANGGICPLWLAADGRGKTGIRFSCRPLDNPNSRDLEVRGQTAKSCGADCDTRLKTEACGCSVT